jgi:hypothetical protein
MSDLFFLYFDIVALFFYRWEKGGRGYVKREFPIVKKKKFRYSCKALMIYYGFAGVIKMIEFLGEIKNK